MDSEYRVSRFILVVFILGGFNPTDRTTKARATKEANAAARRQRDATPIDLTADPVDFGSEDASNDSGKDAQTSEVANLPKEMETLRKQLPFRVITPAHCHW